MQDGIIKSMFRSAVTGAELLLGDPPLPVRYHAEFPWGTLQVTEEAHESIGLQPLMPVQDGSAMRYPLLGESPRTDIIVASHEQITEARGETRGGEESGYNRLIIMNWSGGVAVLAGLDSRDATRKQLLDQLLNVVRDADPLEAGPMSPDELLADIYEAQTHIPMREYIENEIAEYMAFRFAQHLRDILPTQYGQWVEARGNQSLMKRLRVLGGATVILNAVSLMQVELGFEERSTLAFGATLAGVRALLREVKRHQVAMVGRRTLLDSDAFNSAATISDGVFGMFSKRAFEERFMEPPKNST